MSGSDPQKPTNILKKEFLLRSEKYRVVGFEVEPTSVDYSEIKFEGDVCNFPDDSKSQAVHSGADNQLYFTYSVEWKKSDVSWASRWDHYLGMSDVQIHWFSIINSLVVVFFLSGILAMIMIRTLRRDIARYNTDDYYEDTLEETGWKLVHGDVFRPPKYPRLFAAVVGSGIQIFCMALITIFFAMLGMLSPSSRGALMTSAIFLYVIMGLIAGYFAARVYKTLKGREWRRSAFLTATLYPCIVFTTCFFLNFFIWDKHSSGAVPFTTMLSLLCLWFGISVPLVYLGYYFGYRKHPYQHPVRTNMIPRQVPTQQWYMNVVLWSVNKFFLATKSGFVQLFSCLFQYANGRHSPVRRRLHRALLRLHRYLAEPVLLFVRISVSGVLHFGCELRADLDCHDLFPVVRRSMFIPEKLPPGEDR